VQELREIDFTPWADLLCSLGHLGYVVGYSVERDTTIAQLNLTVTALNSSQIAVRMAACDGLSQLVIDANDTLLNEAHSSTSTLLSPAELSSLILQHHVVDQLLGARFHVELFKKSFDVFRMLVMQKEWTSAMTNELVR
jgi:hypothetical protein